MFKWHTIDTVFLDMDGTLLDLHYDNQFWLNSLPLAYARAHQLSEQQANQKLNELLQEVQGTIKWYCIDYWTKTLDLPILELKQELKHLIRQRDDTLPFLQALRDSGKKVVLLTNAHPDTLAMKLERTSFQHYLDEIISSHEFGYSKEFQQMWHGLQQRLPFDPTRTLFVDDSTAVLAAAKQYGIAHLLAIANPDSQKPARHPEEYLSITDYHSLLPIS